MHRCSTRIAALVALLAVPALGSVVIAQTIEEMTRNVPVVVRATVGQVQSSWNEEHTTIETWAEVAITDPLKGNLKAGTILMVRNPGGKVGDAVAWVSGAPRFSEGEDTILFLEPAADTPNVWLVNALAAGKVTLGKDPFGEGPLRATRDLRGIAFYEKTAAAPKYREVNAPEDLGTATAFIARIKTALTRMPQSPVAPPTGVTQ